MAASLTPQPVAPATNLQTAPSTGLISGAMGAAAPQPVAPVGSGTTTFDPTKSLPVNPATDTVQGQLEQILAKGSPLISMARANAAETANARGLLNSSMAAGAGEQAAMGEALPIAQADANTYANAAAQERGGQVESGLSAQGAQQSQDLAQLNDQYQQLISANPTAASMFNNLSNDIGTVMADVNTTRAQKQAAVNTLTQLLHAGLGVVGGISNVDLSGLLDFTGMPS